MPGGKGRIDCRGYALRTATKPIGVATYKVLRRMPPNLRRELPAPEEIAELMESAK